MKDIDFDELDKAVNDVLGTAKPAPVVAEPAQEAKVEKKEESAKPAASVSENPTPLVTPRTSLSVTPVDQVAPAPSPAVRRGRFMDVVHPSADMTTAASGAVSKPPVVASPAASSDVIAPSSRKLAPVSNDLVAEPVQAEEAPAPVIEKESIEPETVAQAEKDLDEEPKLDTIDTPIATEPEPEVEPEKKEFTLDSAEPVEEVVPPVEADNDTTSTDSEQPKEKTDDEKRETPKEEDEDISVPAEIVDDVAASEAPKPTAADTEDTPTPFLADTKVDKRPLGAFAEEDETPPAKAVDPLSEPLPRELKPDVLSIESKEAKDEAPRPLNVLDSPENTADDAQLHHMFSNDIDHQPLVAHKSHSSAWIWILLIVALLVIGAGLGYLWFVNGY